MPFEDNSLGFYKRRKGIFKGLLYIVDFLVVILLIVIRILRLLNLLEWKTIAIITRCIIDTLKEMGYYTLLLVIIVYVLLLIGVSFFKGKLYFDKKGYFDKNGDLPRINYENVYQSSIAVFSLMIGDNWQDLLFVTLRSPLTTKALCYVYFIGIIIFLNIVMMNLVIAFLVNNFKKAKHKYTYKQYMNELINEQPPKIFRRSKSIDLDNELKTFKLNYFGDELSLSHRLPNRPKLKRRSSVNVHEIYRRSKLDYDVKQIVEIFEKPSEENIVIKSPKNSISKMFKNRFYDTHINVEEDSKKMIKNRVNISMRTKAVKHSLEISKKKLSIDIEKFRTKRVLLNNFFNSSKTVNVEINNVVVDSKTNPGAKSPADNNEIIFQANEFNTGFQLRKKSKTLHKIPNN
jgi:hypothetical protein